MKKLCGLRVLNTRPRGQNQALSQLVVAASGVAIEYPTVEIVPVMKDWLISLPDLKTINVAIFTSANAVHFFFDTLKQHQLPWMQTIRTITIGCATARSLRKHGICVDFQPAHASSESLMQLPVLGHADAQNVLLVKGESGRTFIARALREIGSVVNEVEVYARELPEEPSYSISRLWQNDLVDMILITSVQSLENLFVLVGEEGLFWLQTTPCLVISDRIASIAKEKGIKTVLVSCYDGIIEALERYVSAKDKT